MCTMCSLLSQFHVPFSDLTRALLAVGWLGQICEFLRQDQDACRLACCFPCCFVDPFCVCLTSSTYLYFPLFSDLSNFLSYKFFVDTGSGFRHLVCSR